MISAVQIDPQSLYDDSAIGLSLGISQTSLAKARRQGKIRFTRQGRRVLYMGQWIIDWLSQDSAIAAGEARP